MDQVTLDHSYVAIGWGCWGLPMLCISFFVLIHIYTLLLHLLTSNYAILTLSPIEYICPVSHCSLFLSFHHQLVTVDGCPRWSWLWLTFLSKRTFFFSSDIKGLLAGGNVGVLSCYLRGLYMKDGHNVVDEQSRVHWYDAEHLHLHCFSHLYLGPHS